MSFAISFFILGFIGWLCFAMVLGSLAYVVGFVMTIVLAIRSVIGVVFGIKSLVGGTKKCNSSYM